MSKEDFLKVITRLGMAYNKNFDNSTMALWYDYLKDCDYEILKATVKRVILNNKYMPSIAELKEEYAIENSNKYLITLNKMYNSGYFKTFNEYDKAVNFANQGIIPKWLKQDMDNFSQLLLQNTNQIMIGSLNGKE